ncbi:hypothetical protein H4R34_000236 [Dimargaris verticillata]|uniref:SHSP domain-containing protein n=1 Tax=Dimargaris verticillata TaxID=2761393 RepID=A0A9W8B707_9FUNG|nr:hypothetical protein H4R34_000236 [Dimargaris verticillata]
MPSHYSAFTFQSPFGAAASTTRASTVDDFITKGIPQTFRPWGIPGHPVTHWPNHTDQFSAHGHEILGSRESDKGYEINILVPRVIPATLRVTAVQGGLILHGYCENKVTSTTATAGPGTPVPIENGQFSTFRQFFSVPSYVDTTKATAHTENGIVTIQAPKRTITA